MNKDKESPSSLSPYRVLDLTDEKGMLCGRVLGDLGADVIKVEKPGGDKARNIGPFYQDVVHPERSLYWFAYNANKRGMTLDLETAEGKGIFKSLVRTSHFVIESFPPGYLEDMGLGYTVLSEVNPEIIVVSITPFGQSGPYRDYKSSDIVAMAMGGLMYVTGDADRPPVRVSVEQAYLHAGMQAAIGALFAHHYREITGKGQWVDISVQESIVPTMPEILPQWQFARYKIVRSGSYIFRGQAWQRAAWPCKDGQIGMRILTGVYAKAIIPLIEWMDKEGMAGKLKDVNWQDIDVSKITQEEYDSWEEQFIEFFLTHTKEELYREAEKKHIHLLPAYAPDELLKYDQLVSRKYWTKVEHPELGTTITYPGQFTRLSLTPCSIRRRAPLIGEHNQEIYKELEFPYKSSSSLHKPVSPGDSVIDEGKALQGIKVVDFSVSGVGPFMSTFLGSFGAETVKVETNLRPDILRVSTPYKDGVSGVDRSGLFNTANPGKYSMAVDLNHPRQKEVTTELVKWADVIIEGFTVGVKERWGLDYNSVSKINPGIIMICTTSQGQTGPYNKHPAWGWSMKSLCGFTHLSGWPDRDGAAPAPSYTDEVSPWFGLVSIMAALDYRRRTGKGQFIDHSQVEASLHFLAPAILDYTANGRRQIRRGNSSPYACPHSCYRCRGNDRWCVIAVFTDEEWQDLCYAMGEPAWIKDPRFAMFSGRKEHELELDRLIEDWTINYTPEEVMYRLQSAGIASGVVEDEEDIMDRDPQLQDREYFQWVEHPVMGRFRHMGFPPRLSLTPARPRRAPCLGEHTEHVCIDFLGMSEEKFLDLLQSELFT